MSVSEGGHGRGRSNRFGQSRSQIRIRVSRVQTGDCETARAGGAQRGAPGGREGDLNADTARAERGGAGGGGMCLVSELTMCGVTRSSRAHYEWVRLTQVWPAPATRDQTNWTQQHSQLPAPRSQISGPLMRHDCVINSAPGKYLGDTNNYPNNLWRFILFEI